MLKKLSYHCNGRSKKVGTKDEEKVDLTLSGEVKNCISRLKQGRNIFLFLKTSCLPAQVKLWSILAFNFQPFQFSARKSLIDWIHSSSNSRGMISNPSPAVTSLLDSFQSSFRSISWKDSCDLGPFLISSTSMMKVSVLSGGILPDREEGRHKKKKKKEARIYRRCFQSQSEALNHNTVKGLQFKKKKVVKCFEHVLRHQEGKYGRHVSVRAYQKIQFQQ